MANICDDSLLSKCGEDEDMTELLKTLIRSDGLQSKWQQASKRISSVEQKLKHTLRKVEQFAELYVPREAYLDRVDGEHTTMLADHCARLLELEQAAEKLIHANSEYGPQFGGCLKRIQSLEDRSLKLECDLSHDKVENDNTYKTFNERLVKSSAKICALNNHTSQEHSNLETTFRDALSALKTEVVASEARLKSSFLDDMQEFTKSLFTFDACVDCVRSESQIMILQNLDRVLLDPLRMEVRKICEELTALKSKLEADQEDFHRQLQSLETRTTDVTNLSKQAQIETRKEFQTRPSRKEMKGLLTEVHSAVQSISNFADNLQKDTFDKVDEIVNHVTSIQTTVDDHKCCLKHHAKEIEDRSTKYDLLLCQNMLDKAAIKEDVDHGLLELKNVVNWQTNKIENFSLVGQGRRLKTPRRRKSLSPSLGSLGGMTLMSSEGGLSFLSGIGEHVRGIGEHVGGHAGGLDGGACIREDPKEAESSGPRISEFHTDSGQQSTDSASASGDDDCCEIAGNSLLRLQVEGLAMGLVALGYLAFRDLRLGQSRNARLEMEKELLEQLQDLRHWITHTTSPAGWDPSRLTTVALKCAHPRPEDCRGPMPHPNPKNFVPRPSNLSPDINRLRLVPLEANRRCSTAPGVISRSGDVPRVADAFESIQRTTKVWG